MLGQNGTAVVWVKVVGFIVAAMMVISIITLIFFTLFFAFPFSFGVAFGAFSYLVVQSMPAEDCIFKKREGDISQAVPLEIYKAKDGRVFHQVRVTRRVKVRRSCFWSKLSFTCILSSNFKMYLGK